MFTSFDNIYSFIIKATIIGFGILFTLLCCLAVYLFFDNPLWYIPFSIFGIIASILAGSYLHVVLSIPFQLPKKFDPIKNKVALGEYSNISAFQEDIANFLIVFFNFPGADIVGGKFHFKGCNPTIKKCGVSFDDLTEKSFSNNKKRLDDNHKAFHLPIMLGNQSLGYMILITKGYTIPVFYSILEDFENYYLDDQIKHVASISTIR